MTSRHTRTNSIETGSGKTNITSRDGLLRRMDRIERENRYLKLAVGLVLALALGAIIMGQTQADTSADVLQVRDIQIVDADGRVHAQLGLREDGSTGLSFFDPTGKTRTELGMEADGTTGLVLYDRNENTRVGLVEMTNDLSSLVFYDENNVLRAGIVEMPDGLSTLAFYDGDGNLRANLSVVPDGRAGLIFNDEEGNMIWGAPSP